MMADDKGELCLISQTRADPAGGFHPGMIGRDAFAFAGDFFQRHRFGVIAARGHHHAVVFVVDEVGGGAAQARGQYAVRGAGCAAALDVAENGHAGFKLGEFLQMLGQPHSVAGMAHFEGGDLHLGLFLVVQGLGALELLLGGQQGAGVVPAHGAFGHGDDAEIVAAAAAAFDGGGDVFHVVGNFWNENDVRPARNARSEREPAGAVPHDFGDDDAVVAVRGAVQPVNGLGGNVQRGGKAKSGVGHGHVVVDRLGQGDDVEAGLMQAQGVFLRAAAAEADEAIEAPLLVVVHDDTGHVLRAAIDDHAVGLVTAGAEDGAADGKDAGERVLVELDAAVVHEAAKAVAEADEFHAVIADGGFADTADGGVKAGAVAARREDADAFDFFAHAGNYLRRYGKIVENKFVKSYARGRLQSARAQTASAPSDIPAPRANARS